MFSIKTKKAPKAPLPSSNDQSAVKSTKSQEEANREISFSVIGAGQTGKTTILHVLLGKDKEPEMTFWDQYVLKLAINSKEYTLRLFDTAGQLNFAPGLREHAMTTVKVTIFVMSRENTKTFLNIEENFQVFINHCIEKNKNSMKKGKKETIEDRKTQSMIVVVLNKCDLPSDGPDSISDKLSESYITSMKKLLKSNQLTTLGNSKILLFRVSALNCLQNAKGQNAKGENDISLMFSMIVEIYEHLMTSEKPNVQKILKSYKNSLDFKYI